MRISTANSFDTGIDILTRRQAEMNALQDQITTGKRINKASDDPAAAARAERAMASIGRSETSQRAAAAGSSLALLIRLPVVIWSCSAFISA